MVKDEVGIMVRDEVGVMAIGEVGHGYGRIMGVMMRVNWGSCIWV